MTEREKLIEEIKKQILLEMTDTKHDLNQKLKSKLDVLIEHLLLVILYPNYNEINHWKEEIKSITSKYPKLKHNNKYPTKKDLQDYLQEVDETVSNQLSWYLGEIFIKEKELQPKYNIKDINEKLMQTLIIEFINYVCENINPLNGMVDENLIYTKLDQISKIYNEN